MCPSSQGRLSYWALRVASAPLSTYGASHLSNHRPLVPFAIVSSYYLPAFFASGQTLHDRTDYVSYLFLFHLLIYFLINILLHLIFLFGILVSIRHRTGIHLIFITHDHDFNKLKARRTCNRGRTSF